VKERRSEITIHQTTLRQQLRDEEGKTGEVSAQLHDRITRIEKLKKRFLFHYFSSSIYLSFSDMKLLIYPWHHLMVRKKRNHRKLIM
jgi:hypothetical protein